VKTWANTIELLFDHGWNRYGIDYGASSIGEISEVFEAAGRNAVEFAF
jgi:hypothetical protein